ncbi:MAG: hypothetical protein GF329_01320 [Candidatus Lokiarchaeota archaeon]|nr:hypothetical protein [Candidatus Lokiarchaeota archaeon]
MNGEHKKIIEEMEELIGRPLQKVDDIYSYKGKRGFEIENGDIVALRFETINWESLFNRISHLETLRYLDLSYHPFGYRSMIMPESIANLKNIEELNLSVNWLRMLPDSFGQLRNLKKLDLELTHLG